MAPVRVYGSRTEVMHGVAKMTTGGLQKKDIIAHRVHHPDGTVTHRYVSRIKSETTKLHPKMRTWRTKVAKVCRAHPGYSVANAIHLIKKSRRKSRHSRRSRR